MKEMTIARDETAILLKSRIADYVELTKPRIAFLVLFTVAAGYGLAVSGEPNFALLINTIVGTALVAAGASVFNHFLERRSDQLMARTENRPLPSGRLQSIEAVLFALALGVAGVVYLGVMVQKPWPVAIALISYVSYVWIYTPLKQKTTLNTLIGAVPGALPPVIGATAAQGEWNGAATSLFLILFLWQIPHFLAIAWIYREDYARGGHKMLSVMDPKGDLTGRQMVFYCLCLLVCSFAPIWFGLVGWLYGIGAFLLGVGFLLTTLRFLNAPSDWRAKQVMRASLIYLPALLAILVISRHVRIF